MTAEHPHPAASDPSASESSDPASSPASPPAAGRPRPPRWRTAVATLLILLGCLLAPIAATLGWVRAVPADTEAFVAAVAPLISEPAVQDWLVEGTATAIEGSLNVESLLDELFAGLQDAANRRITQATLQALRQPAIDGVRSGIRQATRRIITSPAFASTWEQSLRFSHRQAIAALEDDPAALAALSADGVGLRLGPIVARVRQELIDRGYTLAARIPAIDRTIPILSGPDLTRAQSAYRLVMAAAVWVPIVSLLLVVAGVAVAVRRHRAALWAAVGLALAGLLLLLLLDASRGWLTGAVPAVPSDVIALAHTALLHPLVSAVTAGGLLVTVLAAALWLTGPFRLPRRLRRRMAGWLHRPA